MLSKACRVHAAVLLLSGALATAADAQVSHSRDRRSGRTALLLSLVGVAVPVVWSMSTPDNPGPAMAGMIIGPSIGHFYAGNRRQATIGILGRTGVAAGGYLLAAGSCSSTDALDCLGCGRRSVVRFTFDQNLPVEIAEALRAAGHNAHTVDEEEPVVGRLWIVEAQRLRVRS